MLPFIDPQAIQIPSLRIASAIKAVARLAVAVGRPQVQAVLSALGHFGVGSKGG